MAKVSSSVARRKQVERNKKRETNKAGIPKRKNEDSSINDKNNNGKRR